MDLATIGISLGGADVVDEEDQNVRRILGQVAYWRQRAVGRLLHGAFGSASRFLGREWQLLLRVDGRHKRRAKDTKRKARHKCGHSMAGLIVVCVIHNPLVSHSLCCGALLMSESIDLLAGSEIHSTLDEPAMHRWFVGTKSNRTQEGQPVGDSQ